MKQTPKIVNGWIGVESALPPNGVPVLTYTESVDTHPYYVSVFYSRSTNPDEPYFRHDTWMGYELEEVDEPDAWLPIPGSSSDCGAIVNGWLCLDHYAIPESDQITVGNLRGKAYWTIQPTAPNETPNP